MHDQIFRQYIDDLDNRETFNSRFKLIVDIIIQDKLIDMMANNTIFRLEKMIEKMSQQGRLKLLLRNSTHELLDKILVILKSKQQLVFLNVKGIKRRNRKNKKLKTRMIENGGKRKEKKRKKKNRVKRFQIKEEMMEAYDAVKTIQKTAKEELVATTILKQIKIESD